ncbi:MAG: hypothetical protein LBU65_02610 [Planctomycetaceae bacterium]|jgi:hypothetical protein|nr:hypothetical protein [Planctomycetaceae bacterium]
MKLYFLIISLFVVMLTGCGGSVGVTGKVTYSDGSPLKEGFVIFESGTYQVFGKIDESGNYKMGEDSAAKGIKSGDYKVRITAQSGGGSDGAPLVRHVAAKYENTETSGLVCTVKGKTTFDIVVEKP